MIHASFFELRFADFSLDGGTFMTVMGILDCAALCLNTKNCSSFFYNLNMRSCALSPAGLQDTTGLTPQAGINYYSINYGFGMQCSSSADCSYQNSTCSQGSCQCAVGYSYLPSNSSCVMRCGKYGDDFAAYKDHGVGYCNIKTINGCSSAACMEACKNESTFVCISGEYQVSNNYCYLCDTAWFDLPENQRHYEEEGWVVYHRHCA